MIDCIEYFSIKYTTRLKSSSSLENIMSNNKQAEQNIHDPHVWFLACTDYL
jgi:hypothetical protein